VLLQGVNYLLHEETARRRAMAIGEAVPQREPAASAG
jgi:hypothetical protein